MARPLRGAAPLDDAWRERLLQPDTISGSEILLRCLLLADVDCVFGYPGGAVLYVYDAMYDAAGLRHVTVRHEQGAIHAADGYARASGKVGVCIATSGPGATNLVTGIATAYRDATPLVIITGNVALSVMGTDAFQEADIFGMTMSITKHSYLVRSAEHIPRIVKEAFYVASTGRQGPVLIDLPKDVSACRIPFRYESAVQLPGYRPEQEEAESAPAEHVRSAGFPQVEPIGAWQRDRPLNREDTGVALTTQCVLEIIGAMTGDDAIVTADAGQHQKWAAQYFKLSHPRSLLASSGLGTMGFAFPAAIGAQAAFPDRPVVSINGDKQFQMCSQELAVCAIHRIPVKIAVINSGDTCGSPDLVLLAEAFGVRGIRARNRIEAQIAWQDALCTPGPALVDFVVAREENAHPMQSNGNAERNAAMGNGSREEVERY